MKFYLFFDSSCSKSKKIIEIIKKENLINNCKLIEINKNRKNIPDYIKNIPTIVTSETNQPLEYDIALKWIESKKYFNQSINSKYYNLVLEDEYNKNIKNENTFYNDKYSII